MDWKKEIKIPRPSLSGLRRFLDRGPQLSLRKPSIGRSSKVEAGGAPSTQARSKKRPSGKGRSLKRPSALSKGPEIKMPRLVTDLYADLRERHLLPLVVLLIAGMIAAPLFLGNGSDKTKPAGAPAAAAGAASATDASAFAVVPAARHLRSPEKRLGHRQALNPFRADTKAGGGEGSTSTGNGGSQGSSGGGKEPTAAESSSGGSSSGSTITAQATPTEASPAQGAPQQATPTQPSAPESPSAAGSPTENVTVQVNVTTFVANVKSGLVPGELTEEMKLTPMTKLPDAKDPVVMFAGLSQDDKRALFLMTSEVTGYYGKVHCAVDKLACQMVELKPGNAAIFSYGLGEEEKRYKVVIQDIEPVVTSVERSTAKTVTKTDHEHPAERGSALALAHRFSK
jgi:hypothetical protein